MSSPTLWIGLTILSLALFAAVNVMDKIIRMQHLKSNLGFMMLSMLKNGALLVLLPFVALQPMKPFDIFLLLIAGVLWQVLTYLYVIALSVEEVSRVVPLWNLAPPFTLALAWFFLGERLSMMDYAAFAVLVLGAVLISTHFRELKKMRLSKAFWLMLLATFLIVIHLVILKYLLRSYDVWMMFLSIQLIGFLMAIGLFSFKRPREMFTHGVTSLSRTGITLFAIMSLLSFAAYLVYNYAISKGPLTLISGLDGFQSLFLFIFTLTLSRFFPRILREDISMPVIVQKVVALGLLFVGLWMITG